MSHACGQRRPRARGWRGVGALALLAMLAGCTSGVELIAPGRPPQPLLPGSPLMPHGEIDYHVAPLDTLQIEVNPVLGRGVKLDYGSEVNIEADFTGKAYAIAPGDALSIEINADTDTVTQVAVRPDGSITLSRLSKDINAAGKTPAELGTEIARQYSAIMKSPQVTVAVLSSAADLLGKVRGSYQVGLDGNLVLPGLGAFLAAGRTPDALAGQIGASATSRFRNPVHVSASMGQLTGREVDPRVDPNGRIYFRGPAKVSPDGYVSIQPGGQLHAAGLSLAELRRAALDLVQPLYANRVEVSVTVADSGGMSVFVGGEVRQAGRYPYVKSMTLMQLIAMSGWVTDVGDLNRVLLLHPSAPAHYTVYRANLNEVLDDGAIEQDLPISPQDIVVIPMTAIGKVDKAIDQYIRKIIPFNASASYSYITNPVDSSVVGTQSTTTTTTKAQ